MLKKYIQANAISLSNFKPTAIALILTLLAIPLLSNANELTLKNFKPRIYTNAENALSDLNKLNQTIEQDSLSEYYWLWLRKAEAEGLLLMFNTMEQSLKKTAPLLDLPASKASAQHLLLQGILAQNNGNFKKSENLLTKAIEQAESQKEQRIHLHAKVELAYTYTLQDVFDKALKTNQQAHLEATHNNDTFIIALAEDVYGAIYGYMDQYEQSVHYYQQALEGYEKLGYTQYATSAIFGIATSNRYWGKLNEAIKHFTRYEETLSYTTNESSKFYGRYGMATTLFEMGDCSRALPALNKALATEGPADYKAELYKRKAKCLLSNNNIEQAKQSLNHAKEIFLKLPDLTETTWNIETIYIDSTIKKAEGKFEESLTLLIEFHQKQSDLAEKTYSKQLIATKSSLENQQKDLEIKLLTENSKVQELLADNQLRKNKQQQLILSFLSLAAVLILIFAIIQYRNAKKIEALSIRDDLTGLYNRRYVFEKLNKFLKTNSKESCLSILVIDIDNFKQINDTHGHLAGDSIIRKISQTSLDTLRITDVLGRIGGEEFLFLLPRATPEQAEEIANRLLQVIREKRFTLPTGKSIHVTVSMGICHNAGKKTDAKSIFQKADEALYLSKNSGKDKLSISSK